MIPKLLTLAGVFSFAVMGASAQTQPQVAFIGDNLTSLWQASPQFKANKTWLPYGFNTVLGPGCCKGTGVALTELQQIIAKGQKPIIHVMVEQGDSDGWDDGGNQQALILASYAHNLEQIIKTAQAAKLKIIVGLEPFSTLGDIDLLNNWTKLYCLAQGIPVVDYASAIRGAGFAANLGGSGGDPIPVFYSSQPNPAFPGNDSTLTAAGYALITDMAQTQIGLTAGTFKLTHGYLNATILPDLEDPESEVNGNSPVDGSVIQFTPYGQYSDGKTRIMNNNAASLNGLGTWTSSNQLIIQIPATGNGVATAWGPGTANVHFTSPSGITLDEWVMYVSVDDPCGGCIEF